MNIIVYSDILFTFTIHIFFDWTTFILEVHPHKYTGHCVIALWKAHQFKWLQTNENKITQ